jgi:hypothetical protein
MSEHIAKIRWENRQEKFTDIIANSVRTNITIQLES